MPSSSQLWQPFATLNRIVIVTEDGIAEEGKHEEMIEQDGTFANLHRVQYQK